MRKIFIQIASYRDPNLLNTIRTAWMRASHPNRLRFGICLQDTEKEYDALKTELAELPVNIIFVPHDQTQGLCWAREQAQKLYDGEQFELQIDSHMRFNDNWDSRALKMLNSVDKDKPILTHYCPQWWEGETPEEIAKQYPWRLQAQKFGDKNELKDMLYLCGGSDCSGDTPALHAFISGHFLLAAANFFEEVPIDPRSGFGYEEGMISVRAWTHGWNMFAPNEVLARHTWNRKIRNCVWNDRKDFYNDLTRVTRERWKRLVGMNKNPLKRYGLGRERTLAEYEEFSGIDFKNRIISPMALNGLVKDTY